MAELSDCRNGCMTEKQKGVTEIFNSYFYEPANKLFVKHKKLDKQVRKAYGWQSDPGILPNLVGLNLELAQRGERGVECCWSMGPKLADLVIMRY